MTQPLKITLIVIGSIIGFYGLAVVVIAIVIATRTDEPLKATTEFKGLSITRETFIKSCLSGVKPEDIATYQPEQINGYCGCVYDKGVAMYGNEKFYTEMTAMSGTGTFTPEFNVFINECVQEHLL